MATPPSDQGGLPVFRTPPAGEEPQEEETLPPSPEASSSPSPSSPLVDLPPASPTSSTPASTDQPPRPIEPDADVAEALGALAANAAQIGGMLINRWAARKAPTDLWRMTPGEAQSIGEPLGRIAARRAPAEVAEGDGSDALAAASAVIGYGMHNALGVSGAELERQLAGGPPPPAQPPAPAPPPSQAPPPVVVAPQAPPAVTHPPVPAGQPGRVETAPPSPAPRGVPMAL